MNYLWGINRSHPYEIGPEVCFPHCDMLRFSPQIQEKGVARHTSPLPRMGHLLECMKLKAYYGTVAIETRPENVIGPPQRGHELIYTDTSFITSLSIPVSRLHLSSFTLTFRLDRMP